MLSLILPTRNWPADRIEACVRSFLRMKSKALKEIVIVDFGSDEPIVVPFADKRVRLVRVDAERWSLAEAINTGVVHARFPVIAKTDADIIIARESGPAIDAAVASLMAGEIGSAVVQATDLPEGVSAAEALGATTRELGTIGRLRPRWGQGGLCMFTVADWNEVGGFEARYYGWGNEDNDFADRMRRSGRKVRWLKQDAVRIFHVWHQTTRASKEIIAARTANHKIYMTDKSTFRPIRFLHSTAGQLAKPNVVTSARPLVTVAFASKARPNRERMITEAIRGFVGQIDNDFEVLIADNGSNDEQRATLRRALAKLPKAARVRVIDIEKPLIPGARNRLTQEAAGRYICVADDDDLPFPDRLADHLAPFEKSPNIHGSHGGWVDFDELTGVIDHNTGGERTLATLLFGPGKSSAHPATFFRTDVMRQFQYDENCHVGSDFDLAVRMANMGIVVEHTGTFVTLRRFHYSNVTITDLVDQQTVGVNARTRTLETLGPAMEKKLREQVKTAKTSIWCRNKLSKDQIAAMIPGYCGVWRLLVPLSALGRSSEIPAALRREIVFAETAPGEHLSILTPMPDDDEPRENEAGLMARAQELAEMVAGDVGVIECGIDPQLYFISSKLKGVKKAMAARKAIEDRFNIEVSMIPDVEYEKRRSTRFDWTRFRSKDHVGRVVSKPIHGLDQALIALSKVPNNTALRAMTSILADFNCTDQLYHLVTSPVRSADGPAGVKKLLEKQTGETFQIVGDGSFRI